MEIRGVSTSNTGVLFLRSLLAFAVGVQMATIAYAEETPMPSTAATSPMSGGGTGGSESTTTMSTGPSVESTTAQCMKAYEYDCCQEFVNVSNADAMEIMKQVIDVQNSNQTKASWTLESIETAKKKECAIPYYMVKAKLNKTSLLENSTAMFDCQIQFLYSPARMDQPSAGGSSDQGGNVDIKDFCSGAAAHQSELLLALFLSSLAFFNRNRH